MVSCHFWFIVVVDSVFEIWYYSLFCFKDNVLDVRYFLMIFHKHDIFISPSPHLVHKDLKSTNVLVDEIFISKVADAGFHNFLGRVDIASPSSQVFLLTTVMCTAL